MLHHRAEPAGSNTLIAFAAKAGSTAHDGDGAHSPFTSALLNLVAPELCNAASYDHD